MFYSLFACGIIARPRDGCSSLMARVVDGVGTRVVTDSVDVVFRLRLPLFAYLLNGLSG